MNSFQLGLGYKRAGVGGKESDFSLMLTLPRKMRGTSVFRSAQERQIMLHI